VSIPSCIQCRDHSPSVFVERPNVERVGEKAEPTPLRNEAQLNCVSLRSELDDEVSCGAEGLLLCGSHKQLKVRSAGPEGSQPAGALDPVQKLGRISTSGEQDKKILRKWLATVVQHIHRGHAS
jgi:hypothetical protein